MPQYLYAEGNADEIQAAAKHLEAVFEEDGFAISNFEIDEERGLWALSLYPAEEGVSDTYKIALAELSSLSMALPLKIEELGDIDWVTKSLEGLVPVEAGRFVVHGSHDKGKLNTDGRIAVQINAGQAFGTGHHGTTAGCLKVLSEELRGFHPLRILDLGTGSAVLAIALAKLLKQEILATDIDPISIETANVNTRINEVHQLVKTAVAAGFSHPVFGEKGPFDLIVANILAGPLCKMAPDIAHHTARGGRVILSGLLPHQRARIIAAYRTQGLRLVRTVTQDGWLVLVFKR
ncbi:ribosomal protein L11 methyltransferase [Cohaesibacter sp. ES.047]|uniref:50S ribosomal protein L11 methyltransferase n=1 Tax=Cohaesibacter sp. ES.047 TaxID=1798205 RepID=UPI000BB7C2FB|nr:50S ribosomal protein L11 methyltransferase [Cohaesibacter sp. ES.047]SNY94356.1 ribosomal protein L11 methyltransferase [Cohaesibacter sp. ES.047]